MSDVTKNVRDEFADAAAVNAIGAGTAHDRAVAEAPATADEQKLERELREVAARMSAGSPYMDPSRDLKARVMAETAPANFKMSDYKKANNDAKWWRYGLIAAVLFLVAAAWWNMDIKNTVTKQNAEIAALRAQNSDQAKVLSMLADSKTQKAALQVAGKPVGTVLINGETAVVVGPEWIFPKGKIPVFTQTRNGVAKSFHTIPMMIDGGGEGMAIGPIETRSLEPVGPVPAGFTGN